MMAAYTKRNSIRERINMLDMTKSDHLHYLAFCDGNKNINYVTHFYAVGDDENDDDCVFCVGYFDRDGNFHHGLVEVRGDRYIELMATRGSKPF
jgi:hypothetical protein